MSADDLARFIADRLGEHEQGARAAATRGHESWGVRPHSGPPVAIWSTDDSPAVMAVTWVQPGEHIARHDPAHVLAFVAAGRAILEQHRPWDPLCPDECDTCDRNSTPWVRSRTEWPCPTLRAFGAIWAGHPAWREEWRA